GGGRLGRELRLLLPHLVAPTRAELDVTDDASVARGFARLRPRLVVHCAAYTDVAGAEREREACWRVNVEGTRRLVAAARVAGVRSAPRVGGAGGGAAGSCCRVGMRRGRRCGISRNRGAPPPAAPRDAGPRGVGASRGEGEPRGAGGGEVRCARCTPGPLF